MEQLLLPFTRKQHDVKYCGTVLSMPKGSKLVFINQYHHPYFIEFGDPRWGAEHLFKIDRDFKCKKGGCFFVNNMIFDIIFEEHCDDFERIALWVKEH